MQYLLEAIAEAVHWGRDAQRAPFVALEALPAAGRAPACAWQWARLVSLQGSPRSLHGIALSRAACTRLKAGDVRR